MGAAPAAENESDRIGVGSLVLNRFTDRCRQFLCAVIVQQRQQLPGLASDGVAAFKGRRQKPLDVRHGVFEPGNSRRSEGFAFLLDQSSRVRRVFNGLAAIVTAAVAGDFHQHTVGSIDSGRSLCNRVLEDTAEGLEYAATTDPDNVSDFGPCTRELNLGRWFGSMMGNEISVVGLGHFNAYPLTIAPARLRCSA